MRALGHDHRDDDDKICIIRFMRRFLYTLRREPSLRVFSFMREKAIKFIPLLPEFNFH